MAISTKGTVVWYQHWEDGSEKIWGDGDASNGCSPSLAGDCTDANDVLDAGHVIILENKVSVSPRKASEIKYDGGDKIQTSRPIAITRAAYPDLDEDKGSMMAGAVEVFEQSAWGTEFTAPVGQNMKWTGTRGFEYVALAVMAGDKPSTVSYGQNKYNLNPGESEIIRIAKRGDQVSATAPIQVHLITGDIGSTYELRWYSLPPTDQWSNEYYAPVGDSKGKPKLTVFNPGTSTLSVTMNMGNGKTETISVGAGKAVQSSNYIPKGYAAKLWASKNFFAFSQTDTSDSGQIYDWGYPLIPSKQLTSDVLIGLGYGCTNNKCNSKGERSVVWVTPVEDATIYVDYDNDGSNVKAISAKALESVMLTDDDEDMSGAVIWAAKGGQDGTPVKLAAAWGQNGEFSYGGDKWALDLGTVVPPLDPVRFYCSVTLLEDKDNDGVVSPGDLISEKIEVINVGQLSVKEEELAVQTVGTVFNIEPQGGRGSSRTYTIESIVPADLPDPDAVCKPGVIPHVPDAPSPPAEDRNAEDESKTKEAVCEKVVASPKEVGKKCYPTMISDEMNVGQVCVEVVGDKVKATIEHSSSTYKMTQSQLCEEALANGGDPEMTFACICNFEELDTSHWEIPLTNQCDGSIDSFKNHLIAKAIVEGADGEIVEAFGTDLVIGHEPFLSYIDIEMDCSCSA